MAGPLGLGISLTWLAARVIAILLVHELYVPRVQARIPQVC